MTGSPLEYVHIAPDAECEDGLAPAAFLLHDRGGSETDLLPVAETLPRRYQTLGLRAPKPFADGHAWYGLDLTAGREYETQPVATDLERSLERVTRTVDEAARAFDVDRGRVGLVGLGQGAVVSLALLLERPETFAWVCALHGYLAQTCVERSAVETGGDGASSADTADDVPDVDAADVAGTPVFVAAGSADEAVTPVRVERAAATLARLGADVTFTTYGAGHRPAPAEIRDAAAFATDHE